MADTTILSADIGVTWLDNNRCKYLEWLGGTNTNYTMNQIYSAMQTLQDESATIDDGTCFSAETPTEYTTGIIDQGDNDPWYVQHRLMEKVTGGALKSASWTRATGTNTGIVCVAVSSTSQTIVQGDEGKLINNPTTGDDGTLLEFIDNGGSTHYLIIRPDTNAAGDDFDGTTGTLVVAGGGTASTITAGATTGEQIWANIYTIGTVEDSVHMYIYQGQALTTDARDRVFSWNSSTDDWYGNGHIDTVVALNDITDATWSTIDGGYLNVFARQGGDAYASFEVANSTTSGGRNPIPLQTAADADTAHGTQKISFTGAVSGTFTDGEVISQAGSLARGIIDVTNSTLTSGGEIVYFPITNAANGGIIGTMNNTGVITGADSGATATSNGNPADDGAADAAWFSGTGAPTISITAALADIDNDTVDEYYGISIDCNQNRLSEVYQWVKYITGYTQGTGGVIDTAESGVYGEEFIGGTAALTYTGGTTPTNIVEGESVTQAVSGATGVVLSHDTTNKKVLLRSTRGTFDSNTVNADDDSSTWTTVTSRNFAAKTASPLGTFAGGTFFGARGVLLTDYHADDANLFTLTDIDGGTYERPTSLSFVITNLQGSTTLTSDEDDRVSFFQLTGSGGDIDKDMFGGIAGTPAAGDNTLAVASTIQYIPEAGSLVIVDNPSSATATEYKVRYTSWTGTTFTLANFGDLTSTAATASTDDTNLYYATGGFNAAVKRGDLVVVSGRGAGYVKTVVSDTQLALEGLGISGLVSTDLFEINCVPVALTTGDNMYVPYIDKVAESSSESASFIDPTTQIFYRVKVRNSRNTTTKIKPFSSDGDVTSGNVSVQVVRAEDTIIT